MQYPVYAAGVTDAISNCYYTYDTKKSLIMSRSSFNDGQAVFALTLCLPDSDVSRQASGMDTRGQNSALSFSIQGQTADSKSVLAIAETTSILKIMPGRNATVSY